MEHTCALIDSGDVQCWGNGSSGQNGVQDTTFTSPSSSINFGSGPKPVKIVAGYSHTCALFPDSGIKCWGYNVNGQLGQGNQANFINSSSELTSHPPVDLGTERKAVDVFARGHHTCAILDNHDLKCWGYNNQGQLGQADQDSRGHTPGTLGDDLPPVSLGTNRKVIDVVMGPFNTCALLDDGLAKCFGANDKGQSGQAGADVIGPADGQSGDGLLSLSLGTNTIAQALATGLAHTCALLDGIVKCFGDGGQGALGNEVSGAYGPTTGNMGDYLSPVNFGTDLKAVQVVAGENHTCVLTQLGWVKCWGNSGLGQLGLETNAPQGKTSGTMGDHLDFIRLW